MNAHSLSGYFSARSGEDAIRLLAETTAAMRADAGFVEREDDVAGAAFLTDENPAGLAPGSLDQVMARIADAANLDERAAERASQGDPVVAELAALPSPVREAALAAVERQRWRFTAFGIRTVTLMEDNGVHAVLMRIEPGAGIAEHDHQSDELTLILTGAYNDGYAHYGPGDISLAQPGFSHHPKAEPGEVCYVLSVFEEPPKFRGLIGFLQRTIGFPTAATYRGRS
jgi:putative transcriptional regulator